MTFEFTPGWPDSFLDTRRVEGKDKVLFDGFVEGIVNGQEIPAYMFGVQALWHIKVMSGTKDLIANATIIKPGKYGNSVIINIYCVGEDGTIAQATGYEEAKIEFDGEGN